MTKPFDTKLADALIEISGQTLSPERRDKLRAMYPYIERVTSTLRDKSDPHRFPATIFRPLK